MRPSLTGFRLVILFISATILFSTSCQREVDSGGFVNTNPNEIQVMASVRGVVIDENNQPVVGAAVTSGTSTTSTDQYGVFTFKNINLSRENGTVKVSKAGYFNGIKTFYTTAGRMHYVRIRLLPKTISGSFSASTGGTITLSNGGKLVIPASSISDASGNVYSGTVNVAMTWIDPTSNNLPEMVPGDLRGLTTSGQERGLETYGMLGVELTSPGNQVLKISTGKTAELSFPIPASLAGTAPATIALWNFDEATARWKEEGSATKTGNMYVANVSHFSFWNCDAPFPLITLSMTVVNSANSQPLNHVQVRIKRPNNSYGYGWTDSVGYLSGKVPANEALVLEVMDQCNNVAYSQNIGPFSANASLGTISVSLPATSTLTITGTVTNCAGANVTHGAAIIYTSGAYSHVVSLNNGNFSLTLIRCNTTALNFTVVGVDYTALQQSVPVSGNGTTGTVNVGTVQACGTSSSQFAQYIIDGTVYSFVNPPDPFICTDSTGAVAPHTQRTTFASYTSSSNGGSINTSMARLTFSNSGQTGTLPINSGMFMWTQSLVSQHFANSNPVVNITLFGPSPGGFIEGNFNEPMVFGTTIKNVNCSFRVRRN